MAAINEPKYSKSEVSQKFNLKELLGYSPSEDQKRLFYELAVDKMVDRTLSGKDINNKNFTPYSKAYAQKKGVSRNSVDLVLSGDMLQSFEESQGAQRNIIKIKVAEGENTRKSFNHNVGDTLPQRNYFGFKDEGQLRSVVSQVNRLREKSSEERKSTIDLAALRSAINQVTIEAEGFDGEG